MIALKLDINERLRRAERNRRLACAGIGLVLALAVGCGSWWLGKRLNYALQYEDMVRATVREMVKPEAMREGP